MAKNRAEVGEHEYLVMLSKVHRNVHKNLYDKFLILREGRRWQKKRLNSESKTSIP